MDPDAAPERTLVGALLGGKYRVRKVLGEGGVGVVYEAENSWTGRRVALKVLRPEFAAKREVVRRFKREAQAATQIDHPNIVDVLDMGEDRAHGTLYIVQELLTGTDLRCWLDHRGVLPPSEAVEILTPVMGALVAAHRRGIIHRDIKPENIFLVRGSGGRVLPKLIDFGISKIIDATSPGPKTTSIGTAVGTPNYMSPEQARGDTALDGRSDVWSVGAVLYEMLCGRAPFEAPTHTLLLLRIVTERPTPLDSVNPSVPAHLVAIVHRALEPDPSERYPSMRALLADLVESPAFCTDSDGHALPAAQWDELQLAPVARDVGRAETLALPSPVSLAHTRFSVLSLAALAAAALLVATLGVPTASRHAASAAIHAGMPVSSTTESASASLFAFASGSSACGVAAPTPVLQAAMVLPAVTVAAHPQPEALALPPVVRHGARHPGTAHPAAHATMHPEAHATTPPSAHPAAHPAMHAPRTLSGPVSPRPILLRPLAAYPDE